ncbi:NAD(P)H nitroreductase [Seminibacterium arietis]|uniref:Putative NAD(P)H nitroreductase n=1 Tax=Seminibacterium arietis TaxID=1173502 RepID=A0ABW3I6U7_9PAST
MDSLTLLTTRRSNKKLIAPAPNKEQLETMFKAALHVPDHGHLQPYRFFVLESEKLERLSNLLKNAVIELNLDEKLLKKAESFTTRTPMIIAVVSHVTENIAKVPAYEQELTAGCAAYAIQLAANSMGFDNVWVTGPWIQGTKIREAFHCRSQDKIIGLIMIGTAENKNLLEVKKININQVVCEF